MTTRTIHLHGPLAERYGAEPITLRADNFAMLLRGLQSVHPTIRRTLLEFDDLAIVKQDGDRFDGVDADRLGWSFGNYPDIHLSVGRRGAGFEVAAFTFATYTGWAAVAAYVAVNIAVSIAVSFVMGALSESPRTTEGEETNKKESNLFNGAVNVLEQGHPVPLVYGTFKVGSVTISTEVVAEKQSVAMNDYVGVDAGTTVTGNVLTNDLKRDETIAVTSFEVNGVTSAVGATYTHASYSVTISSNGAYSVTTASGYSGTINVEYTASGSITPQTTAELTVQSTVPFVWENPGGA